MQQFNEFFIDHHLIPFMQRMLIDVLKSEMEPVGSKEYFRHLFEFTTLTGREREAIYLDYFNRPDDLTTPFVRNKQDVNDFLDFFMEYLRKTANVQERKNFFLPTKNPQNQDEYFWPSPLERNLHVMAYEIAGKFEKIQISREMEQGEQSGANLAEIARKKALNAQGLLMLIQNPDGTWRSIEKEEASRLSSAVPFITIPSQQAMAILDGNAPQGYYRTSTFGKNIKALPIQSVGSHELKKEFQKRRTLAVAEKLKNNGIEVVGAVRFRNDVAIYTVRSPKGEKGEVKVKFEVEPEEKLILVFQFDDQEGKKWEKSIREDQIEKIFSGVDEGNRLLQASNGSLEQPGIGDEARPAELAGESPRPQENQSPLTVERLLDELGRKKQEAQKKVSGSSGAVPSPQGFPSGDRAKNSSQKNLKDKQIPGAVPEKDQNFPSNLPSTALHESSEQRVPASPHAWKNRSVMAQKRKLAVRKMWSPDRKPSAKGQPSEIQQPKEAKNQFQNPKMSRQEAIQTPPRDQKKNGSFSGKQIMAAGLLGGGAVVGGIFGTSSIISLITATT